MVWNQPGPSGQEAALALTDIQRCPKSWSFPGRCLSLDLTSKNPREGKMTTHKGGSHVPEQQLQAMRIHQP